MSQFCVHAGAIVDVPPPRDVCEACVEIGGTWVHLRQCLSCARTLCCDNSPNPHMTGHFREIGHPIMRGADPGESWTWCYEDDSTIRETPDGWETYDPFVEAGVLIAKQHLDAGRTPDPASDLVTPQGFPLGEWFEYVRDAYASDELDERDVALIEAIPGWRWQARP